MSEPIELLLVPFLQELNRRNTPFVDTLIGVGLPDGGVGGHLYRVIIGPVKKLDEAVAELLSLANDLASVPARPLAEYTRLSERARETLSKLKEPAP